MRQTFLSHFTPSLMKAETLEEIFVQRDKLAAYLIELIQDSVLTESKHHTLLIGQRGMGKTHLISLIYHRVNNLRETSDLKDRLIIAWLQEEEHISTFLDLLLRIFRAILRADLNSQESKTLQEQIDGLYKLSPKDAENRAKDLLKEFVNNRILLLLMENLDDIFNALGNIGQKQLRSYLQENPFCTILATSQSLFNGISQHTSPFYGFFRVEHLEKLSLEMATQLLANIATYEGNDDLATFITTSIGRARIRVLHHLAGGNHRVYIIFSQFLTRESLDNLVKPFMELIDDLTPYYQSRMQLLSPQQRKIVEYLCERRGAVQVKDIAEYCFITHATAAGQLKELRIKNYVQSENIGRESYYELCEPLMRICIEVKMHRNGPIQLFLDFLRLWYTPQELQERLTILPEKYIIEREHILEVLNTDPNNIIQSIVKRCAKDYKNYIDKKDFQKALEITETLIKIRGASVDWHIHGYCLGMLGNNEKALASINESIKLDPNNVKALHDKAVALSKLNRFKEAINIWKQIIDLEKPTALTWCDYGVALGSSKQHQDALFAFEKSIEIEPSNPITWRNHGIALSYLRKYKEAVISYEKALTLGDTSLSTLFYKAECLFILNQWDEGFTALDMALKRFTQTNSFQFDSIRSVIKFIFLGTKEFNILQERIKLLIALYEKHNVLPALSRDIVESIHLLKTPMISIAAIDMWYALWKQLVGDKAELQVAISLLNTAVNYLTKDKDPRFLLELPTEEREILKGILAEESTEEK